MKYTNKKRMFEIVMVGLLLVVIVTLILFQTNTSEGKTRKIILIPKTLDASNDFWTSLMEGANLSAQENGAEIEIVGANSEQDIEGQIQKIEESIEKKPDAILVAPGDYALTSEALQKVVDHGITLVLVDSVIDRDIAASIVSTDNYVAGKELGEFAATLLDENSQIGIVAHVQGTSTAMERETGIRDGLGEFEPQVKEIVFCNSSYERAYEQMKELLVKYPGMNVVIGTNEYSAVGAARAIKDLGLAGKVTVVGFDSSIEEIQLLEEGIFEGIVIQKPFNMGYLGVEQALRALDGESVEKNVDSGSMLITRDNMYEEENQRLLYPFSGQQ